MTNEIYNCIFYHSRSCSLREQMDWGDSALSEQIRAISKTLESGVNISRLEYLYKFCRECPHIRPNTKLDEIIRLLNVANPVSIELKWELEEKIKKLI